MERLSRLRSRKERRSMGVKTVVTGRKRRMMLR
jgi:hypothetical protein